MPRIVLAAAPLRDGPTALRPWRDSDLAALVEACQDPEIPRWTRVPSAYGPADARLYLQQRHDGLHAGTTAPYAVIDAAADRLLGSVSLMRFLCEHGRAEAGYWLAREARGAGHAVRALRLICRWGFETLGLQRIDLLAAPQHGGLRPTGARDLVSGASKSAGSKPPCSPMRSASHRRS